MGAAGAEAHVARAQQHGPVGQAKPLEDVLGAAGHAVELFAGLVGMGHADHLDLLELVLAQHARRVLARGARLGAEALGVGDVAARQVALLHDHAADDVGERHLRGRHQPPAVFGAVAFVAELRKLAGPEHRLLAHQHRGPGLGEPVLLDMGVDHELRQGPVDAGDAARHHHEAGAAESRRCLEVHSGARAGDLEMLSGREAEGPRLAPAADLGVGILVRALGHVVEGQVGQFHQHVREPAVELGGVGAHRGDFVLFLRDGGAQALESGVVAARLGGAGLLGGLVLLGEGGLGRVDPGAALGVDLQESLRGGAVAAPGKGGVERVRIVADCANVVHCSGPSGDSALRRPYAPDSSPMVGAARRPGRSGDRALRFSPCGRKGRFAQQAEEFVRWNSIRSSCSLS